MTGQPLLIDARVTGLAEPPLVQPLAGKVALVTGAARGIGEATARLLAQEGAHVVCLDRPADDGPASQVARSIGGSVLLADVADPEAPAAICRALKDRHGGVDIVVHNAGITRDKTLARMKPEAWAQTIDINLAAIMRIDAALNDDRDLDAAPTVEPRSGNGNGNATRAATKVPRGSGPVLRSGGRIICLSSVAGLAGNVGQTNYAASKAGVAGYVRHLAGALAARGVTVNAVAPGFIETRMTAAIPMMIREAGRRLSALGQGGLPQDVGEVITFLASPGAVGVTGATIRVCGGALIGA